MLVSHRPFLFRHRRCFISRRRFFVSVTGVWFFCFASVVPFPRLLSLLCVLMALLFVVKAAVPLVVVVGDGGVRLVAPLVSDLCVVVLRHVFMVVLCSGGFWSKLLWRDLVSRRKAMLISLSAFRLLCDVMVFVILSICHKGMFRHYFR
jgi:hypothetical protein